MGTGDRFMRQGKAQLRAILEGCPPEKVNSKDYDDSYNPEINISIQDK